MFVPFFFVVEAKTDNPNSNKVTANENRLEKAEDNTEIELPVVEAARARSASAKINKIIEETNDPEVIDEVETLVEEQEQVETRAQVALEKTAERPAAVKFLIGPDYKNLGQLRSEIVHIQNNIRHLERLKEKAGEDEVASIDEAILELKESESGLQSEIYNNLSGFSLFGWLFKWLGGFTPEVEVTPTPTATSSASPTGTPTAAPTSTASPSPTPTPTI